MKHINKHYTSPIDEHLDAFDQHNPPSQAQIDEAEKYRKIVLLRDEINLEMATQEVHWDKF